MRHYSPYTWSNPTTTQPFWIPLTYNYISLVFELFSQFWCTVASTLHSIIFSSLQVNLLVKYLHSCKLTSLHSSYKNLFHILNIFRYVIKLWNLVLHPSPHLSNWVKVRKRGWPVEPPDTPIQTRQPSFSLVNFGSIFQKYALLSLLLSYNQPDLKAPALPVHTESPKGPQKLA